MIGEVKQRAPLYIKILTILWILSSPFAIYQAVVLRDALYGFFAICTIVCSAMMFGGSFKAGKVLMGIWTWASVFPMAWQFDHGFDWRRSSRLLLTAVYILIIYSWLRKSRMAAPPAIQPSGPAVPREPQ
jgi:hypothetical protein